MAYHSRHCERDNNLPLKRKQLLETTLRSVTRHKDVIGVFVGGSIAKGNEDLYSDIDLRIVIQEDVLPAYIANKEVIVGEWGNILFLENFYPKAPFLTAHYDSFLKVDVFFYNYKTLKPSIWLKGIRILLDHDERLKQILDESEKINFFVTKEEVLQWRGKVFSYLHEIYRRVMREEYYYALTCLNNLRQFIVQGWDMEAGRQPNEGWDWSKVEGARSQLTTSQLSMLVSWDCRRDDQEIMRTLTSMIPELTRIYDKLLELAEIVEDFNRLKIVIDQII